LSRARILDVGCGDGDLLASLVEGGADPKNCLGLDLMPERVTAAQSRLPEATFMEGNAACIPLEAASGDVVVLSMLISSVLSDSMAAKICRECKRVLARGGVIAWFDSRFPNPANSDVRAVGKRTLRRLFPEFRLDLDSITVVPPLARALGGRTSSLYPALARVPFLRARYAGLLFPPGDKPTDDGSP
jgi:ubiquinone/menaquinone biosynthesis C-methylase UbiE